ncbi:bifunctional diacylglycerol diphosphate phosphatase/phosphatidate phosphatase [Bulinus truncatus]|nr:bifunctional diacylglycerol diphosphate phosphatase/phosphatidate phosphatase [Bulinus truncatus]
MADQSHSQYIIPNNTEVALLDCQSAFEGLSNKERLYAHHLAQASFKGGLIVLFQTSPESPGIFLLLQKLFRAQDPKELSELALSIGFSQEDVDAFLIYAAAFYGNMGNYKSFGDTKFIPNIDESKVEKLIKSSKAYQQDASGIDSLWNAVHKGMFSLEHKELGLGKKGISTYYSANCDEEDAKIAQEFLDAKEISPYNTRLFKTKNHGTGEIQYEVRLASVESGAASDIPGYVFGETSFVPKELGRELKFTVTRGDYSPLVSLVVDELKAAQTHAANDLEKEMLGEYVKSFFNGSILAHKDGSRFWIRNKGPIVETYIGFIESYRDPFGVRGEFEGFVAVVNKAMSTKFSNLVNNAEHLLAHLPWPADYEKDQFLRPDFTSLDVLAFGGSGIPAGINIPNYDEADDIIFINWLNMVRAGLLALEFYSPETSSWRQAHMNARFVILRVLIEAGENLVRIEKVSGEDGKPDLLVTLDRAKIISVGKPAIGAFLRKLQLYKSTADVEAGRKMYSYYSDVNDQDEPKFLSLRSIVLDRKQPRKLFVQHHTYIEDGVVHLKSYDPSASGLIKSFADRFPSPDLDAAINQLWEKEKTLN